MKSKIEWLLVLMILLGCNKQPEDKNEIIEVVEDFSTLESRLDNDGETLWVINFWATSCPPCVKEMPHFNNLETSYPDDRLKVLLVSLDRAKDLDGRVYPFVQKHQILPEVIVLEDQDYSKWTAKIDSSWFGALPATLIINSKTRSFKFGMYESYEELIMDVERVAD